MAGPEDHNGFAFMINLPMEELNDPGEDEFLLATQSVFGRDRKMVSYFEAKDKSEKPCANSYTGKLFLHTLTCFLIVAHLIANSNYLFLKAKLYFINMDEALASPWLLLLLGLEFLYFGSSLIAAMDNLLPPSNRPDLQLDGHYFPTVHILLPCCKEPTEVPVESIRAALKMDYPLDRFKVLVLDDGGDDDLKAIVESLQVETGGQVVYLRRKKTPGVPHHFKCGNLNYGLQHSNSEYVVMMDADMILHRSFLRRVLPHIVNSPDISFVQIPQSFYNLPVGDPLNDASIMFYDKVQGHRDYMGCATCVGTGCLFRRKHLNAIGGFQSQSITEDTTTAYALFREGYRSVYLNEKLQTGLTPWTFEGYIKQHCRWGQGAMQQFKATSKSMLGKESKLNFVLKVLYFWHSGFYFLSIVNFILVACLLGALLFKPKFTVGNAQENRELIMSLCYYLLAWRLMWTCLWLQVPQSIQSRNRDESSFWWMSPFFVKMIFETFFSYSSTFKFVPTSNIDRISANREKSQGMRQMDALKHVKFHLAYTFVIVSLVLGKIFIVLKYYGLDNCGESFYIFSVSVFLLTTCAHMMLPVMFLLWPTSFKPAQRRSLLKYDADGAPMIQPQDYIPKFDWSVLLYEAISIATFAFWLLVLWMLKTGADKRWCTKGVF